MRTHRAWFAPLLHGELIRAVEEAADDLIRDVLEDYQGSLLFDPAQMSLEEDDDDEDE